MKKKLLMIVGVACMFCLSLALLAGCGGNSKNSGAPEYLGQDGKFVVGFDETFEPFAIKTEDGHTGFDIELAQAVAEKNGWEIELSPIDWDTKDAQIDSGTIDVIWNGFSITDERQETFAMSDPYYSNQQVVIVPANSDITSLSDLAGKTVVAQVNSPAYDNLAEDGQDYEAVGSTLKSLVGAPEYNTAIMMLQSGAADAVAIDLPTAQAQMAKHAGEFVVLDEVVSTEAFGIGAKKGNTALIDQIQKTLLELYKDGTVKEIASHYPGEISMEEWLLVE